jgi:hypothetical protein
MQLETGTTDQYATYSSGSSSNVLVFNYTVQSGDTSSDLDYKASNSFSLNSGTIKDIINYDATLTLPSPGSSGSLSANKAIIIDNTAPTSPSISINNGAASKTAVISRTGTDSQGVTYTSSNLEWEIVTGGHGNWGNAESYCSNLELASSALSTSVTLTLSATDAEGVTGYYASESSTAPSVSASDWSSVTSSTSYSGNVSFTFSSANEDKTVYVWFKDAAGNVSTSASADITYKTDWRLPTKTELASLIDLNQTTGIVSTIAQTLSYYWTSTTYQNNTSKAWGVGFGSLGLVSDHPKTHTLYVRCVRP